MSPATPLAPAPPPAVVAARVEDVWRRVRDSGRDPATVRLVAVTKGFDASAVTAALAAGVRDIGENYPAELLSKASLLAGDGAGSEPPPRWHFLGAVQRRRVRDLAPVVGCWQTLARAVEGEAIAARAPGALVFVEVDVSGLPGRNGCPPGGVPGLVAALRHLDLDVGGLMVVAPPGPPEVARTAFRTTARLAADLGLVEVSMGMTQDLEVALEEGTTMLRVGRALFGPRPEAAPGRDRPPTR
ncbi:MAG TPA: alanine racemase [Acidimicrobiales bacterium]|nr:alanine racemase [Acidimicrobiales bacterium]